VDHITFNAVVLLFTVYQKPLETSEKTKLIIYKSISDVLLMYILLLIMLNPFMYQEQCDLITGVNMYSELAVDSALSNDRAYTIFLSGQLFICLIK